MKHAVYDENKNIVKPVFQLGFKDVTTKNNETIHANLVALVRDDVKVTFIIEDRVLKIVYGTDNNIDNLQAIARKFGLVGDNVEVVYKTDIYKNMTERAFGKIPEQIVIGNVVLFSPSSGFRTPVPVADITKKAWIVDEWPVAALYQTMFCQVIEKNLNYYIATPIKADGTVLTLTQLDTYLNECSQQEDAMVYDSENNNILFGITDNEDEANILITLLNEFEDHIMSSSIPTSGAGKVYHDSLIEYTMDHQGDSKITIQKLCSAVGISSSNAVQVVNTVYPIFNCNNLNVAYGRFLKMLYHELWVIIPRGK